MVIHFPVSPEGSCDVVVVVVDLALVVVAVVDAVAVVAPEVVVELVVGVTVASPPPKCTLTLETVTIMLVTLLLGGASVTSMLTYPMPTAVVFDSLLPSDVLLPLVIVLGMVVVVTTAQLTNSNANAVRIVNITKFLFMIFLSFFSDPIVIT